jgi:hypothetical protein
MMGSVGILNIGCGDTKLVFDKDNPADCIRAARIVSDMIRRGYALLVEVDRDGVKKYQRVKKFDEARCEYIIADFDPVVAQKVDADEHPVEPPAETGPGAPGKAKPNSLKRLRLKDRAVKASRARATAIPRTAGG